VSLGEVPDVTATSQKVRSEGLGDRIGQKVEDPVEHFDQEREFRQHAAVEVIGEARGVGSGYGGQTAA
jgi:hypothetical protein